MYGTLRRLRGVAFAVTAGAVVATASGGERSGEALRDRVAAGELIPLAEVFDTLEADYRGRAVEVELRPEGAGNGDPAYAIQWMGPDGQLARFRVHARTGEVLGIEGVQLKELRRR